MTHRHPTKEGAHHIHHTHIQHQLALCHSLLRKVIADEGGCGDSRVGEGEGNLGQVGPQPTDGDVSRREGEQSVEVTHSPGQLSPVELELSDAHLRSFTLKTALSHLEEAPAAMNLPAPRV